MKHNFMELFNNTSISLPSLLGRGRGWGCWGCWVGGCRSLLGLGFFLLSLCLLTACSDDTTVTQTQVQTTLQMPEGVEGLQVSNEQLTFKNLTTGITTAATDITNVSVPDGLYDVSYKADAVYTVENVDGEIATRQGTLTGSANNVEIVGSTKSFTLETYLSPKESDDFIFEEIFFSGTLRSSGSQYYGDSYVKIYNNTDHVLYADGVAFCESKFKSTQVYDYTPDIRKDTFAIWSLYVVPGNGTDHPVPPGGSMILCDTGIDHRNANPNSFDLSAADFEWYDISSSPSNMDIDSETVPNLDKWYCYTRSFYLLHNRGFTSFALARIPKGITKEEYLKDYIYEYDYTMYLAAGTFYMHQNCYKMPNSWIIDGVNCSVEAKRVWNILPPSVDAGWTHVGYIDKDQSRYFRSIRRKLLYLNPDGTMHLKDTNNSTEDFNTECIPSIIELQGTAISADGTKASTLTYDGVQAK